MGWAGRRHCRDDSPVTALWMLKKTPITAQCVFAWQNIGGKNGERLCNPKLQKNNQTNKNLSSPAQIVVTTVVTVMTWNQPAQSQSIPNFTVPGQLNLTEAKSFCRREWRTTCSVQMCQADIDPLILTQGCKQLPKAPPLTIDWTGLNLLLFHTSLLHFRLWVLFELRTVYSSTHVGRTITCTVRPPWSLCLCGHICEIKTSLRESWDKEPFSWASTQRETRVHFSKTNAHFSRTKTHTQTQTGEI